MLVYTAISRHLDICGKDKKAPRETKTDFAFVAACAQTWQQWADKLDPLRAVPDFLMLPSGFIGNIWPPDVDQLAAWLSSWGACLVRCPDACLCGCRLGFAWMLGATLGHPRPPHGFLSTATRNTFLFGPTGRQPRPLERWSPTRSFLSLFSV